MTHFEMIKSMSIIELAKQNIRYAPNTILDDDCFAMYLDGWVTSDGKIFPEWNYDAALEHEIRWLHSDIDSDNQDLDDDYDDIALEVEEWKDQD